uniref:Spindlin interactor and repressor of chromatin binding n=1 Tax=Suricata suricatta TaxID=37032 RepID=A0A673VB82_SURSU
MALKAEGAALDCFEVTLKCEEGEDEEEAMVVAVIPRPEPMLRVAQQEKTPPPRPSLLEAGGDGCEEPRPQVSWEQEFLVGNSPGGSGRALCMVCGAEIRSPSADTARMHILEQHPHTLDLSPSEKSNILEAWSEGVDLLQDVRAEQPSSPASDLGQEVEVDPDSDTDPTKMPAEIVVLLDSEDNPSLPKRSRPRGLRPLEFPATPASEPGNKKPRGQRWKEPPGEEPVRKKRGRPMTKNLDLDPDPDPGDEEAQCGRGCGLRPQCSWRSAKPVRGVGVGAAALGLRVLAFSDPHFHPVLPSRPPVTRLAHRDICGSRRGPPLHGRQLPAGLCPPALLPHPAQGLRQQGLTQRGASCRRRPSPAGKPLSSSPSGTPRDTGSPGYPRADGGAAGSQPPARLVQAPPGHQGRGSRLLNQEASITSSRSTPAGGPSSPPGGFCSLPPFTGFLVVYISFVDNKLFFFIKRVPSGLSLEE